MVFVTSGQGGSATHRQISMSSINSSSCGHNCGKQVQLHVNALKVLKFPTAMVSSLTHSSCNPGGQVQKQNSSIPKGQGCIGVGQSQVQLSSFSILGRSQVKVHGVGAVVAVGGAAVVVVGAVVVLGGAVVVVGGSVALVGGSVAAVVGGSVAAVVGGSVAAVVGGSVAAVVGGSVVAVVGGSVVAVVGGTVVA